MERLIFRTRVHAALASEGPPEDTGRDPASSRARFPEVLSVPILSLHLFFPDKDRKGRENPGKVAFFFPLSRFDGNRRKKMKIFSRNLKSKWNSRRKNNPALFSGESISPKNSSSRRTAFGSRRERSSNARLAASRPLPRPPK